MVHPEIDKELQGWRSCRQSVVKILAFGCWIPGSVYARLDEAVNRGIVEVFVLDVVGKN